MRVPEESEMPKKLIFISHTSAEAELARALKQHLVHDFLGSFDVFVSSDGKTIPAGKRWLEELSGALRQSLAMIVLCSDESVTRPWVNFEAGGGWVRDIPVIPVCHSGMAQDDLPAPLNALQAVELSQPQGLKELYEAIAEELNMQPPRTDFQAMSAGFKELEAKYKQERRTIDRIEHPRVLCMASKQYCEPKFKFDLDVQVLQKAFPQETFPDCLVVERDITSSRLRGLLTAQRFDIIHLVLAVDRASGDLLFSPAGGRGSPIDARPERMHAEAFAGLLQEAQTRLVVLATCSALLLAVRVAHVANMIGADVEINGEQAEHWGQIFYGLLAQGCSLYKAFELTKQDSDTPMLLIRQKDVALAPEAKGA
jgi:hypothetical protein